MGWFKEAFTTEAGQARRAARRAARRPPPTPTVGRLTGNMPGASWTGAYDPNTGAYNAPQSSYYPPSVNRNPGRPGTFNGSAATAISPAESAAARSGPTSDAIRPTASGTSAYIPNASKVQGDATGRAAALEALQGLRDRSQTGWTQLDRAALDQAQRQASQYEQAQRGAITQNMAARGMNGSGLGMMAALDAQQSGADRAYDAATNIGIAGRDRALAAQQAAGQLGLGIDTQQFAQGMARGAAADDFNAWATGTNMNAQQFTSQMDLQRWQTEQQLRQQRMQAIMGMIGNAGSAIMGAFGGGGSGGSGG